MKQQGMLQGQIDKAKLVLPVSATPATLSARAALAIEADILAGRLAPAQPPRHHRDGGALRRRRHALARGAVAAGRARARPRRGPSRLSRDADLARRSRRHRADPAGDRARGAAACDGARRRGLGGRHSRRPPQAQARRRRRPARLSRRRRRLRRAAQGLPRLADRRLRLAAPARRARPALRRSLSLPPADDGLLSDPRRIPGRATSDWPNSSSPAPSRRRRRWSATSPRRWRWSIRSAPRECAADRVPRRAARLRRPTRARRPQLRDGARRDPLSRRPQRLRQDDGLARRRRPRLADLRRGELRRRARSKARAATSRWCSRITRRRCCPGARRKAMSRWRWRRWAARAASAQSPHRRAARTRRPERPEPQISEPDVGRHAAAAANRALSRAGSGRADDGRAVRRARRHDAPGPAGPDAGDRPRDRRDDPVRHPRSRRGDLSRRPRDRARSRIPAASASS